MLNVGSEAAPIFSPSASLIAFASHEPVNIAFTLPSRSPASAEPSASILKLGFAARSIT